MLGEGTMTPAESGGCWALVQGRGCSGRGRWHRLSLGAAGPWREEGDARGGDDGTGRVWGLPGPGEGSCEQGIHS